MKYLLLIAFTVYIKCAVLAQEIIRVDAGKILKPVAAERVGINLNYLTDDNKNIPKALKQLGTKVLRFPGGEKSDNYIWGQRPFTQANHTLALTGNCHWPNNDSRYAEADFKSLKASTLDFDEFMKMAKKNRAQPLIVINADAHRNHGSTCGGVPSKDSLLVVAQAWVHYANVVKHHNIKYWMIGNESFNSAAYAGKVTPQQYRQDVKDFARALKSADPSIKIIINGNTDAWWRELLSDTAVTATIDYLGLSAYPLWNWSQGYSTYQITNPDFTQTATIAREAINRYVKNPTDRARIRLLVTETNAIDFGDKPWANTNDLAHALVTFEIIGQHLVAPKVDFTLFWNTQWVKQEKNNLLYNAVKANGSLFANGQALLLWNKCLLDNFVAVTSNQSVATYATKGKNKLTVFLVNKDTLNTQILLDVNNFNARSKLRPYSLRGSSLQDTIPVIHKDNKIRHLPGKSNPQFLVPLAPHSITVLQLKS